MRTYVFEETGEELPYAVFVSSKVKPGAAQRRQQGGYCNE
jgi:hypothetical protein